MTHASSGPAAAIAAGALFLTGTVGAAAPPRPLPAGLVETVSVDCAAVRRQADTRATGFLGYLFPGNENPKDELITPLKPRWFRSWWPDRVPVFGPRALALGMRLQPVIADHGPVAAAAAGDTAAWDDYLLHQVRYLKEKGWLERSDLDIINEPDNPEYNQRAFNGPDGWQKLLVFWKHSYDLIRREAPDVRIIGPSTCYAKPGSDPRFEEFLRFCKANDCVPDLICWHFPGDLEKETAWLREFCAKEDIAFEGVFINEYILPSPREHSAGRTAFEIAQLERVDVVGAVHAIWSPGGLHEELGNYGSGDHTLDDLLTRDERPRGQWWVYSTYADQSGGDRLATQRSESVDLVASRHAGEDRDLPAVRILLGNRGTWTGLCQVELHGLEDMVPNAGVLRYRLSALPDLDHGRNWNKPAVEEPELIRRGEVPITDGSARIPFAWGNDLDAYAIEARPMGRAFGVHIIPGRIEAEDFDNGGEGVAYHETEETNFGGGDYRSGGVDIKSHGDGLVVGWNNPGEWREYTLARVEPGRYDLLVRAGTAFDRASLRFLLDGRELGRIAVPNSGDWTRHETLRIPDLDLTETEGIRVLRTEILGNASDIDWIEFAPTPENR